MGNIYVEGGNKPTPDPPTHFPPTRTPQRELKPLDKSNLNRAYYKHVAKRLEEKKVYY
jgi:hypothetical protein